jgi:hypothetical protein
VTVLAFFAGAFVGVLTGALVMAILCASGNAGGYVHIAPDDIDEDPELTVLRHQLTQAQDAAGKQRERADFYQSLYCDGARANAQLRKGNAHAYKN